MSETSESGAGWGSPAAPFISYAQNQEDVLLKRVFGSAETGIGFYVDVGAFHPVEGSVTKAFYDRGWSGINVEPSSVFEELAAARPRDVNLRMAVLDRIGEIPFAEDAVDRGMSRVVVDGVPPVSDAEVYIVSCDTLEGIVGAYGRGRPVDFLKVDAEGSEAAIVRSTDWRRFRPRVLVLETTLPWTNTLCNQDWEPLLLRQGFLLVYFDGINCFYVREEDAGLVRHFRLPVNTLDWATKYDPRVVVLAAERDQALAAAAAAAAAAASRRPAKSPRRR